MTFINIFSGAFIMTLEKDWFSKIDDSHKVPLYMLVSSSFAFTIVYMITDIFEFILECVHFDYHQRPRSTFRALVVSNLMHLILLTNALTLGLSFGFIFGYKDVEKYWKNVLSLFYMTYLTEMTYFAPIGILIGTTGGLMFMVIRAYELANIEK